MKNSYQSQRLFPFSLCHTIAIAASARPGARWLPNQMTGSRWVPAAVDSWHNWPLPLPSLADDGVYGVLYVSVIN